MQKPNSPQEQNPNDENLHLENEILKIKLQAETGGIYESVHNLPPEVENDFLHYIMNYEEAWKNVKYVKVHELIGQPDYRKEQELSDSELGIELDKVWNLLLQHNMQLDILGEYEPRVIYKFITEELFKHETDNMHLPGMFKCFLYEEFHPNHRLDIQQRTEDFLKHWFNRNFDEYALELNNVFILHDNTKIPLQTIKQKLNDVLGSYTCLENYQYTINHINFRWDQDDAKGKGHSEGRVSYDAVLESGEILHIEDSFKFYMLNEDGYWNIYSFVFPGYTW